MASNPRLNHLFQTWLRGEWGKARWDKPVKAEALEMHTCPKCQAAFVPGSVSATKSELCPDCT